jgi:hypothetical protein
MLRVHATCVEVDGVAVLLRGPSGSGKSDLALRLIDAGAALVADDQVELHLRGGRLEARPPVRLAGLIEVRGLGIVSLPWKAPSPLALAVDLAAGEAVARLPDPAFADYLGQRIPLLAVDPFAASAPAKLRLAAALARRQGLWPALVRSLGPAA